MSLKSRFCVKCGMETDLAIQGLCSDCYLNEHPILLPAKASLKTCTKCGAIQWQSMWVQPTGELEDYLANLLFMKHKTPEGVRLRKIKVNPKAGTAELDIEILGQKITKTVNVDSKIEKFACPTCSRQFNNDWLAKLQVRTDGDADEVRDQVLKYANKYASKIFRTEEQKRGVDILFFDKTSANNLSKFLRDKMGFRLSITRENVKQVKGTEVWRDVILMKK